ncbi:hypothetical protein [Flammeovirga sp. OC4]|uniref:hypothetical protein n=1 Tax=Flammeovirga sp. OC4 TaxID=1382345 RepID=UPI0005C45085|nr:hypothetical protein [Flammeovirga sp. OC4]
MRQLFVLLFLLNGFQIFAQESNDHIKLFVSSRVDTTSKDVRAIIQLYENYYKSKPDSIYNNPYWNKKEKELYHDFDFSRVSIFQGGMDATYLFRAFSPFVMSVEPLGEKYQIRVLFASNTTNPKYIGSKVWCIQKLNAIKENDQWVLENLIVEISKKWSSKKSGVVEYVYPPNYSFDKKAADNAKGFCADIIKRFNPDYNSTFKYYVTNSIDDMGLLENFDFYFVGITTGKAREGMILTAKGNEYYPHEFVHKLLPENPNRGYIIEEGLAVYLGTRENKTEYVDLMNKLATNLKTSPKKINFKSIISQEVKYNGYPTAYPAGAGICELIYNLKGDDGLIQLMKSDTKDFEGIIKSVCSITKLMESEVEVEWNKTLEKYFSKSGKIEEMQN